MVRTRGHERIAIHHLGFISGTARDARYRFVLRLVKTQATVPHRVSARASMGGQALVVKSVNPTLRLCHAKPIFRIVTTLSWRFNGTLSDAANTYIVNGINSPTYAPGIDGDSKAMSLDGSQCAVYGQFLDKRSISFTWEFWVYLLAPSPLDL